MKIKHCAVPGTNGTPDPGTMDQKTRHFQGNIVTALSGPLAGALPDILGLIKTTQQSECQGIAQVDHHTEEKGQGPKEEGRQGFEKFPKHFFPRIPLP